jgi:hypothetical protein
VLHGQPHAAHQQLPDSIVSFVASHLELKNTLARAREEMEAAAKAPGLFDHPAAPQSAPKPASVAPVAAAATLVSATETVSTFATDEEDEILAEIGEETSEAGSGDDVAA